MLTVLDGYCGAGGSSSGAEMVPGIRVRYALNHWQLAIDTHNANMPHVDHDRVNIPRDADPRRYAATDIGWFSPECKTWSMARGEKCDYEPQQLDLLHLLDDDEPEADEAKQRSRFQMETVPLFASVHRYRAVIVENVPDILKWGDLDRWLGEMHKLRYRHRTVILNSAFAHQLGPPAPQLRDRVYFLFWQARYRAPDVDKWTRPQAWCPDCGAMVRAVYAPNPGKRRPMRYNAQYRYRCPSVSCRNAVVHPFVLPAAAAIDWSLPTERIGDRKTPLRPKTHARIEAGLKRYARPITLEAAGNTYERRPGVRTWPVDDPLRTVHTTASKALACPPLLVPAGGGRNRDATSVDRPMRTRTATETEAVACPPFLAPLRSGRERTIGVDQPLATVVADGSNHALVDPLLVPVVGRDGVSATPVTEPARTQTSRHEVALVVPLRNHGVARPAGHRPLPTFAAEGYHHMVARWDHRLYAYDTGELRPLGLPLPTQTTVQGDALLGPAIRVEDCTFRMLEVEEIKAGMAFVPAFILLGTAKRNKVRMLGNAVTPPAARDLIAAVVEAITGEELDRG